MNKFELPTLPYAYNALEPHFDEETMIIHHQRHHQAYVDNLNKAIETNQSLEQIMPQVSKLSPAIRNNGGGHYNHSLFWKILSPSAKTEPTGKLAEEINSTFGSLDKLKEEINKAGVTQFGSGWAWLYVKYNGTIAITATANQDNPLMDTQLTDRGLPILGVDVWEHAYYLKYRNKRADYLDAFWSVLDWEAVERNYEEALAKIK